MLKKSKIFFSALLICSICFTSHANKADEEYWEMTDRVNRQINKTTGNETSILNFVGKDGNIYTTLADASKYGGGVVRFSEVKPETYQKAKVFINGQYMEQGESVKKWADGDYSTEKAQKYTQNSAVNLKNFQIYPEKPVAQDSEKITGLLQLKAPNGLQIRSIKAIFENKTIYIQNGKPFTIWETGESFYQNGLNLRTTAGVRPVTFEITMETGKGDVKTTRLQASYQIHNAIAVLGGSGEGTAQKKEILQKKDFSGNFNYNGTVEKASWNGKACVLSVTNENGETVDIKATGIDDGESCFNATNNEMSFENLEFKDENGKTVVENMGVMRQTSNDEKYSVAAEIFDDVPEMMILRGDGFSVQIAYNPKTRQIVTVDNKPLNQKQKAELSSLVGNLEELRFSKDANGIWTATNKDGSVSTSRPQYTQKDEENRNIYTTVDTATKRETIKNTDVTSRLPLYDNIGYTLLHTYANMVRTALNPIAAVIDMYREEPEIPVVISEF